MIGGLVRVKRGATPAGLDDWDTSNNPDEQRRIDDIGDDGTFLVAGWWWNPRDLEVAQ